MFYDKIPPDALRELQDALGVNNASADTGLLQVYSYMNSMGGSLLGTWFTPPLAVVLPSTREEVMAALRICKKYGLKVKPHSTAWVVLAIALSRNVVIMDLRRMTGLEIDTTDGYAVVEPYCTAGEQQVEIMKFGLNSHVNGAGPNASNLASATSVQGSGGTSQSMSNSERNCLGVELCLPNGEEVLHMGTPGTPNAGWFCGDGPGPSLRGMMRGAMGGIGSQGVYTRCGMKCYPWFTEPFQCNGSPPFFDVTPLPDYSLRTAFWPDYDCECDALYRIGESELTDYCARLGAGAYEEAASCTNEEYMSMVESGIYRNTFPKGAWTFSLAASCPEEHDARMKILEHIVGDTGGIIIDTTDLGHDAHQLVYQTAIRGCYIFKAAFMPTSAWSCFPPMSYETIDNIWKVNQPVNCEIKKKLIAEGSIEDDYYDNVYASLDENSHFGHDESPYHLDLWEPQHQDMEGVVMGIMEYSRKKIPLLYSPMPTPFKVHGKYIRKIYEMLDPDRVMDAVIAKFFLTESLDNIDKLDTEMVNRVS